MQLSNKSKLGIALRCQGNASSLLECATYAERVGFDSLWLVEVAEADVMALAATISEITSSIKIATGVVNSNLRLPTLLAMGSATLSQLSKGRFILGVGAGDKPMSYRHPVPGDTALTRLRETLEIVSLCLCGERVEYMGEMFQVSGFELGLKPQYKVPIFGAAMGLRMVEEVVKIADGVLLMMPTLSYMKQIRETIDSAMEKTSSKESKPSVACHLVTAVSENAIKAEENAKRAIINYIHIPVYRNSFSRMGFSEEVSFLLESLKSNPKDAWEKVPERMAQSLIIYGKPEDCVQKINSFISEGVMQPVIYPCMAEEGFPANVNKTIRLFAPFL